MFYFFLKGRSVVQFFLGTVGLYFGEDFRASGHRPERTWRLFRLSVHHSWCFAWPGRTCAATLLPDRRRWLVLWNQRNEQKEGDFSHQTPTSRYFRHGSQTLETLNTLEIWLISLCFVSKGLSECKWEPGISSRLWRLRCLALVTKTGSLKEKAPTGASWVLTTKQYFTSYHLN